MRPSCVNSFRDRRSNRRVGEVVSRQLDWLVAAAPHQCQSTYAVCQAVCGQSPVLVTLYKPRDRIENLHTYGTVRPTFSCCSRNNIWGYDEPPICFKMLPTWSSKSPISQITASRGLDWSCRQLHSRRAKWCLSSWPFSHASVSLGLGRWNQ